MPKKTSAWLTAFLMSAFFLVMITGCATPGRVVLEDDRGAVIIESKGDDDYYPSEDDQGTVVYESEGEGHYAPREGSGIPPGHMPPPGKCRIWYPDLPPGKQPPPGDCNYLRYRVPPDAWLIEG